MYVGGVFMVDKPNATDKIVLPKNLQREMMKFFARVIIPRNTDDDKEKQQTSPKSKAKEC
jgi:hypothetical protein